MNIKLIYTLREFPPKPVHTFKTILYLISDLILIYFILNTNAVDFCQSFADNGKRIDYGFGGNTNPVFPSKGYLIIDQYFWEIDFNVDRQEISFFSKQGNESKGFRKGYRTVFTYLGDTIGLINVSIE